MALPPGGVTVLSPPDRNRIRNEEQSHCSRQELPAKPAAHISVRTDRLSFLFGSATHQQRPRLPVCRCRNLTETAPLSLPAGSKPGLGPQDMQPQPSASGAAHLPAPRSPGLRLPRFTHRRCLSSSWSLSTPYLCPPQRFAGHLALTPCADCQPLST